MMRFFTKIISIVILTLVIQSCSNIKIINQRDFYSDTFLTQMGSIQLIYKDGDKVSAFRKLQALDDKLLTQAEVAKKYNLEGVMLFSERKVPEAIESFLIAKNNVAGDLSLASNIQLNLASSYFKQSKIQLSYDELKITDTDYLKDGEKKSYHKLAFTLANQLNLHEAVVTSLIYLTKDIDSFEQFEDYKYKESLVDNYNALNTTQRVHILDENYELSPISIAYLGKQEAMSRFYKGDRSGAQDVVDWLANRFSAYTEVKSFVDDYEFRVDNFSKINSNAIGVIAPLTGKSARFGKRVISGINTAIASSGSDQSVNIYVKDNQNNTFLARKQVQELVLKHHVSAIIGGMNSTLAKAEYLEARKYGVLYISLFPVYLPRSDKDHLLIEVPGSVESQLAGMLTPENLNYFGKRVAVLYPWSDAGKTYVNELWSLHNSEKIELKNLNHYKKGISDYRDSVKKLLGLKFPRERKKEYKIWNEIKKANKRSVRVVNILPPVLDFDWIFIPANPREALQIMPTFGFFDAKNLKFVGGPSWISKTIRKERRSINGKIYVIGNDLKDISPDFVKLYKEHNGVAPRLVDTLSYEGMNIILKILAGQNFKKRAELGQRILSFSELQGITSSWKFEDGLWLKSMDVLRIGSSGIKKMNFESI